MKIYCITNSITGKKYIGQTTQSIEDRWKQHCSRIGCRALSNAIKKYGIDAFSIKQIAIAESQDQLNQFEQYWINHFGTLSPNGYNLNSGGKACGVMSQETKDKMRATNALPEVKARRSESMRGRIVSAETRIKKSLSMTGKKRGPCDNRKPHPAHTINWANPEWRAMMIEKRHAGEAKRKVAIDITNALPETKLRRSEACRMREARPEVKARRVLDSINREAKKRQDKLCHIEKGV